MLEPAVEEVEYRDPYQLLHRTGQLIVFAAAAYLKPTLRGLHPSEVEPADSQVFSSSPTRASNHSLTETAASDVLGPCANALSIQTSVLNAKSLAST